MVLGGARSGKSDLAHSLALKRGAGDVLFVATAQALDAEMCARIERHRAGRDPRWRTVEVPRGIARALAGVATARVTVIDCLTLWCSNILLEHAATAERELERELEELLVWYRGVDTGLVVVSNEVGMGIVPEHELGRVYRDLLGTANRKLAAAADRVYWLAAGLAIELRSSAVPWENA